MTSHLARECGKFRRVMLQILPMTLTPCLWNRGRMPCILALRCFHDYELWFQILRLLGRAGSWANFPGSLSLLSATKANTPILMPVASSIC